MEITIDCGGIATKRELHEHIAEAGCSRVGFDAQNFWDTFEDAERENPCLTVIFE